MYGPGVQRTFGPAEKSRVQAHLSDGRPAFWTIFPAVFAAGWLGGSPGALLWGLIGCYAVVDVLNGFRRSSSPA